MFSKELTGFQHLIYENRARKALLQSLNYGWVC